MELVGYEDNDVGNFKSNLRSTWFKSCEIHDCL